MAHARSKHIAFVCNACRLSQGSQRASRSLSTLTAAAKQFQQRTRPTTRARAKRPVYTSYRQASTANAELSSTQFQERMGKSSARAASLSSQDSLAQIQSDIGDIIDEPRVPKPQEIVDLLERAKEFARFQILGKHFSTTDVEANPVEQKSSSSQSSSGLLDDLEDSSQPEKAVKSETNNQQLNLSEAFRSKAADTLAQHLYDLVRDPKVNLTRSILRLYTNTQCLLGQPQYLPEVFEQYRHKPKASQPSPSSPITFTDPTWRNSPMRAIPLDLAETALNAAIYKRDMKLAVAITDVTVSSPAHRNYRFMTKGMPKLAVWSIFPYTLWTLANWAPSLQNTLDWDRARFVVLVGGGAYVTTYSIIAFVAVTTWSDHHDRVHWQSGTVLGPRWMREDERRFLDLIAQAWGFEDKKRRGEEVGAEWEALRDTIGLRSMVLDKTEFMEGFS